MKKILLSISCFVVTLLSFGQAALVEKITRKGNELVISNEKYTIAQWPHYFIASNP